MSSTTALSVGSVFRYARRLGLTTNSVRLNRWARSSSDTATRTLLHIDQPVLSSAVRDDIYHIGREALANSFRHSRATEIVVEIEYSVNFFRVMVRDNGIGITADVLREGREGHWGLSGMRERSTRIGATLKVLSAPGAGTEIDLAIPASSAFEK